MRDEHQDREQPSIILKKACSLSSPASRFAPNRCAGFRLSRPLTNCLPSSPMTPRGNLIFPKLCKATISPISHAPLHSFILVSSKLTKCSCTSAGYLLHRTVTIHSTSRRGALQGTRNRQSASTHGRPEALRVQGTRSSRRRCSSEHSKVDRVSIGQSRTRLCVQ